MKVIMAPMLLQLPQTRLAILHQPMRRLITVPVLLSYRWVPRQQMLLLEITELLWGFLAAAAWILDRVLQQQWMVN